MAPCVNTAQLVIIIIIINNNNDENVYVRSEIRLTPSEIITFRVYARPGHVFVDKCVTMHALSLSFYPQP